MISSRMEDGLRQVADHAERERLAESRGLRACKGKEN